MSKRGQPAEPKEASRQEHCPQGHTHDAVPAAIEIGKTLLHEMIHVRHPDWSEEAVVSETRLRWNKMSWKEKARLLRAYEGDDVALAEALLLLGTCVWIIRESVLRLTSRHVEVDASIWAFVVMGISIAVDISRSRMLSRVATKHRSQALEADALHFSTDVWSSAVVIVGLLGVRLAGWFPGLGFLVQADAVAALIVAGIVVFVSGRLGVRTIQALLDTSPPGAGEQIRAAVAAMEGVFDCHAVRVRHSGPYYFVDLHITVDGEQSLRAAHELTERVEQAVAAILPGADVTVHPEPAPPASPAPPTVSSLT